MSKILSMVVLGAVVGVTSVYFLFYPTLMLGALTILIALMLWIFLINRLADYSVHKENRFMFHLTLISIIELVGVFVFFLLPEFIMPHVSKAVNCVEYMINLNKFVIVPYILVVSAKHAIMELRK